MSQINWSPETPVHTGHLNAPPKATVARLVVGGVPQPHTEVPGHTPLSLQIGVPVAAEPPPPPASGWPEFAFHPNELVRPGSDLEHYLRAHTNERNTIVIDEDNIGKLNELAQRSDPAILGNHVFTTYGDDFGILPLTVNFGGDTGEDGPAFQGFRMVPGGSGICARHYGKGEVGYRLCNFVNAYKGIASTSKDADIHLHAQYCTFDAMSGSQCAAMYGVRGSINSWESVITNIGHRPGEQRGSTAELNHAFYAQWDCKANILDTFVRTCDSHAVNARKGGVINGLLAIRTANGIGFGHDKSDRPIVHAEIRRAIVANTEDVDPETRKTGVGIGGERARIRVSDSVIADEKSRGDGSAFRFYNDCQITLGDNVRVQGMPRVVDVTGHRASMGGTVLTPGYEKLVNSRPEFSAEGVKLTATNARPLTLPDFDKLPTPKPGYVGKLIDSILEGA